MKKFIGVLTILLTFTINAQNQIHFFTQVNDSNNDAEEDKSDGGIDLTSTDLELCYDKGVLSIGNKDQWVGIRFTNINIPKNALIDSAFIQFTVDETENDPAISQIYGEKSFNSTAFADLDYNVSSRMRTDTMLYWTIQNWDNTGDATDLQKSPNLKLIIKEVIGQSLWQTGNAMTFIFEGSGTRTAEAYDGESQLAPVLHIYYKEDFTNTEAYNSSSDAVKIYPNPAHEVLNIDLSTQANSKRIEVNFFSMSGKLIFQKELKGGTTHKIDVDHYNLESLIIVEIKTEKSTSYQKIFIK